MRKFNDFLDEQLQDEEFKKEYDDIQPELDVIKAIVDARISKNLTQKELAQRTGINQADISKKLAEGMDMALKIEFVPKQKAQ